jgi:murein DD-endopeptidase MepM/ murein hydrolase activator NlpD
MADAPGGHDARPRHWLVDALFGGSLALGLITVANAALPRVEPATQPPHDPLARVLPRPPPRPAPAPPAFIAFQDPAPGYPVISPFGLRQLPWEETGRLHEGVDIAAPAGLPVLAAADGVVTRIAVDPGYGRFVEVSHAAGLLTRYGHLERALPQIRPGLAIKAGQPLGEMGSTGASTGSHLHFEVRDAKGRPLNPEMFLGRSFAAEADLPLKAASRFPRGVRVAYVSRIPKAKLDEMQARIELADSASDAAVDAADGPRIALRRGRPHARFRMRQAG